MSEGVHQQLPGQRQASCDRYVTCEFIPYQANNQGMMAGQRQVILFDPISDKLQSTLNARIKEYSKSRPVKIFSGTWNLNGKAPDESLDPWLFPEGHQESVDYPMYQYLGE